MTAPGAPQPASRTPLRVYVSVVVAGAGATLGVAAAVGGPPESWGPVVILAVLAMLSWILRERDVGSGVNFSFTSIVLVAAAAIVTPLGAAVVGLSASLVQRRGQPLMGRVFNAAMITILGGVGGLTYRAAGGAVDIAALGSPADIMVQVGLPLMVADIVHSLLNAALVAGVMQASRTGSFRPQFARMLTTTGPAYIGYGVIGFLFVVLWIPAEVGWFSSVLILAPLFVARWAFVQYGEEQRAHESTLRALVAAAELREPGSAAHSSRVALLCEWIAEQLGLGPRDIQDVRTAGMLHDLGLIAVPSDVLRRTPPSSPADVAPITAHPSAAVAMLRGIAFVHGALPAIRFHHERVDGRGYPDGLVGDTIPIGARVVAVADAFDALTTAAPGHTALIAADALVQLRRRQGSHLDQRVVEALSRAVSRHGWTSGDLPPEAAARPGWDHDDPASSDLLATEGQRPAAHRMSS